MSTKMTSRLLQVGRQEFRRKAESRVSQAKKLKIGDFIDAILAVREHLGRPKSAHILTELSQQSPNCGHDDHGTVPYLPCVIQRRTIAFRVRARLLVPTGCDLFAVASH